MSNTSEFWNAIKNRKPRKKVEIQYRAYHKGKRIIFSRSGPADGEWPEGDWITITRKEYDEIHPHYDIVEDGKIVRSLPSDSSLTRLVPSSIKDKWTSRPNNIVFLADDGDYYKLREDE